MILWSTLAPEERNMIIAFVKYSTKTRNRIDRVGGQDWNLSSEEAIRAIELGNLVLFVESPNQSTLGNPIPPATVQVICLGGIGEPFLKSTADETSLNNLDNLPNPPMHWDASVYPQDMAG